MKLIPMPKSIQEYEGTFTHRTVKIVTSISDERIAKAMQKLPISDDGVPLEIEMGTKPSEAYILELTENKISLRADGPAGAFYGIQTLRQIFENDEIPCLYIEDKPDFSYRGFYHDITRGRVPKVEAIKKLIDEMAYYKMNSLQLYVEHTFAFAEMADITERTGYLTAEEIKELDDYCYENYIEFVPSIATFGHLYELLQKPEYKELCVLEDYEPSYHFWVERMRHHTIDPINPKSFGLVKSLIDQYMPLFRTDKFNICCDETFDLSEGRHKNGDTEKLYVDFVLQLISYLKSKGKTVMMWADILLKHPTAIEKLPSDIQFLNWHYGREVNEDAIAVFERLSKTQIVCPGTQSWATFCPWIEHAQINISKVAQLGKKYNALGILNTNWGDYGHPCSMGMCMYPMVFGAAKAWNVDTQNDDKWEQSVDSLLFAHPQALALLRRLDSLQLTEAWSTLTCWYSNHISREKLPVPIPPEAELLRCIQGCEEITEILKGQKWEKDGYREEMLIAAEGMQVIAQIFAAIAGYPIPKEISVIQWLETYKQQWRKESKESELYVIENLFLFADENAIQKTKESNYES